MQYAQQQPPTTLLIDDVFDHTTRATQPAMCHSTQSLSLLLPNQIHCCRAEAADELAPAARRLNLAKMAAELEGQAASWQLMQVC
jgi:hypothetical protein